MAFQNGFEFFNVFLGNPNPRRRQDGKQAAHVQTQDRLLRTHRKHYEFAGFERTFPFISLDVKPGDQASAVEEAAVTHLKMRQDDQR
jgi:hypothetical protein